MWKDSIKTNKQGSEVSEEDKRTRRTLDDEMTFFVCVNLYIDILSKWYYHKDNNIGFSFRIQGSVDNAQAPKSEFRNTSDNSNSWKVQMSKSGEGQHTITNFWIVNKNGRSASSEYSIKQGDSARYKRANDNGDHINVYLTAENNNFMSSKTYTVTGYWDEETGVYL
jgi:hypothetical protein